MDFITSDCISRMTTWLLWFFGSVMVVVLSKDLTLEQGHLKPFGDGGLSHPVEELDYFPSAKEFFDNYVKPLKPVKMKGAAKMSAAFGKWTDDYFLAQEEPSDHRISVETKKKESRQQAVENMQFKDFVKMYNNTEHYMVDSVPVFLRHEIMIPCPLQCKHLIGNELVDNVMWYSSGGTKSVVHTDSVDNINCLYRGDKTLVFVDPDKYGDKVDLDRPEGAYSSMDVDSVDYQKFPGMADVEFYHVNVTAGDCLYIPYLWIHQVRSFGSNLAVNVWWKHHLSTELDYSECNEPCDPDMTLKDATFVGFEEMTRNPEDVKQHFLSFVGKEGLKIQKFVKNLMGDQLVVMLKKPDVRDDLNEMFSLLDINKDTVLSKEELQIVSDEVWAHVSDILQGLEDEIDSFYAEQNIDIDEENNEKPNTDDDPDEMDLHDEL